MRDGRAWTIRRSRSLTALISTRGKLARQPGCRVSGVVDTGNPVPYSVVVFRDPDNIQPELIYMAS